MFYFTKYLSKNIRTLLKSSTLKYKNILLCNCRFYNVISNDIPNVSVTTIKRTLKNHNLKFEDGHTCFVTDCPICTKTVKPQSGSKVYINKTTGYFSCHSCNSTGSWNILENFFGSSGNIKDLLKYAFTKDSIKYKTIMSNTKPINKLSDEVISSICSKFGLPIVSSNVLNLLNIRINESQNCLYIPLTDIEGNTSGFRILELSADGVTERTEPVSECRGLLVARASRARDGGAVIVPGLRDALSLLEARVPGSVVCLPYALTALPLAVLPALERFTRIVLWFGSDVDTARNFAKKLGERRCYFVRPTDKQPLPHAATDPRAILAGAQPVWHKAIITFAGLRQDVLSDLQNLERVQGVQWRRFPALTRILKGHRRGELTIVTGPTGCGKTTFISEYSLDLAQQNVNTLWGSFEIRNARLARTMLQQLAGVTLDEHLDHFDYWADQFERLPLYFMTFHGQQAIKVVMEAVEHATYVHDIAHVIIDNVQFMMGLSELEARHIDRFWKQDAIIGAFRMFATRRNCHVTLVIHPRKERDTDDLTTSSIFGGAKASQEADNVLIIQDKRLTSVRGKKYLQVAKNRYSGDLGVMPMEFDKASLSYAVKKKKPTPDEASTLPVHL